MRWRSRIRQTISTADYLFSQAQVARGSARYHQMLQSGRTPLGLSGLSDEALLNFSGGRPVDYEAIAKGGQGAQYGAGRAAAESTLATEFGLDEQGNIAATGSRYTGLVGGGQAPRYFDGDELRPASMSVEQRGALQRDMVMAGLLTGDFTWGQWDAPTATAYANLLAYANQAGMSEQEAMRESRSAFDRGEEPIGGMGGGEGGGGGLGFGPGQQPPPFQVPAYEAPDPAALANDVRGYMFAKLGRSPSQDELDVLIGSLERGYRARYEQYVVPQARQEYEMEMGLGQLNASLQTPDDPRAQIPEWLGGPAPGFEQPDADVPSTIGDEGEITAVDAEQEFFDEFRRMFGDPDRRKQALETSARGQSAGEQSMARAMSILGGS